MEQRAELFITGNTHCRSENMMISKKVIENRI